MGKKKSREPVPPDIAARILFISDRICCICRIRSKPIQIHHIDGDPSNNSIDNLAVLCFDCHRETQIHGGFDRKLDADQVLLYRNDWLRIVAQNRVSYESYQEVQGYEESQQIELITSIAEIYQQNKEYELLAMHYDSIENFELRDKYIEKAIQYDPSDQTIRYLRCLQGKPTLIPEDVKERELARYKKNEDWSQRARFFLGLGMHFHAAEDYVRSILESLKKGSAFSAAYYLKEIVEEGLIEELFSIALREAAKENDLWWQVRALQELGWGDALKDLILKHSNDIEKSNDFMLLILLAKAQGERQKAIELSKDSAHMTHIKSGIVFEQSRTESED